MEDEEVVTVGIVSRMAAIALLAAGLVDVAVAAQIALFAWQQDAWIVAAEVLFLVVGAAQVVCGAQVYGGEFVFTVLAVVAGVVGAFVGLGWFVALLVFSAALSPLPLFAAGVSALAALASLGALPGSRRVTRARRELM